MKRLLHMALAGLLLAPVTGSAAPKAKAQAPAQATIAVGQIAPWFAGWTLDQKLINRTKLLKDADASGHLVIFFATWCKPCKKKLKYLSTAREALSTAGVRLVLVDYAEAPEKVSPFLDDFKGLAPDMVILDQFGKMSSSFGVTESNNGKEKARLPLAVLLDGKGQVKAIYDEGEEGKEMLDKALALLKK
ncbi:MAG: TlpA family protein disulfide reductase [Bradymonadia bacterium]